MRTATAARLALSAWRDTASRRRAARATRRNSNDSARDSGNDRVGRSAAEWRPRPGLSAGLGSSSKAAPWWTENRHTTRSRTATTSVTADADSSKSNSSTTSPLNAVNNAMSNGSAAGGASLGAAARAAAARRDHMYRIPWVRTKVR